MPRDTFWGKGQLSEPGRVGRQIADFHTLEASPTQPFKKTGQVPSIGLDCIGREMAFAPQIVRKILLPTRGLTLARLSARF